MYAFFIQWSPEIYAEDTGEYTREPGFIVVKKMDESEPNEAPAGEAAAREWEVRGARLPSAPFAAFTLCECVTYGMP